ncbi:VanZ family protein [Actinacidiphila sp. DG2A-62]|uniref:VanZ family protein n=1 Tax=Actinacidiphila sp. DG2A-62 TaxID=3108821 RepID=UPI002DBBE3C7|nr:VanZ family protein [Actinacidiphila sp. DG2A-62]MEC3994973.1 VanZ family protein [Actinacidiphila sp. DG2A-62]
MFSAIFSAQPHLLIIALIISVSFAALGLWLSRTFTRSKRVGWTGAGAAFGMLISATLTPAKHSSGYSGTCTISKNFLDAVGTEQWSMNLLLFVPLALFLMFAGASCLSVVTGSLLLSVAIEVAQASISGIGRACDSDDVIANTSGAIVVAALFALGFIFSGRATGGKRVFTGTFWSKTYLIQGSAGVVLAVFGLLTITMNIISSSTPLKEASSDQERIAAHSLEVLFGHSVKITRTQISSLPNPYGDDQKTLVVSWQDGVADLAWPSAAVYAVESTSGVTLDGYRALTRVHDANSAKSLAAEFAKRSSTQTPDAVQIAAATEAEGYTSWRVTYSQKNNKTAPYFSVTFSGDGRLMQFAKGSSRI